jgi:hypothetical protein
MIAFEGGCAAKFFTSSCTYQRHRLGGAAALQARSCVVSAFHIGGGTSHEEQRPLANGA